MKVSVDLRHNSLDILVNNIVLGIPKNPSEFVIATSDNSSVIDITRNNDNARVRILTVLHLVILNNLLVI